jgi:hypothetical protein
VELEVLAGAKIETISGLYRRDLPTLRYFFASPLPGVAATIGAEVWLYKQRSPKKAIRFNGAVVKVRRPSGWFHPADYRYATRHPGKAFYSGKPTFWATIDNVKTNIELHRFTEFPSPVSTQERMSLVDFDPYAYFKFGQNVLTPGDLPLSWPKGNACPISPMRRKGGKRIANFCQYFQLRLVINNPDQASPYTKIVGPPSSTLRVAPLVEKFGNDFYVTGFRYQVI